MSEPGDLWRRNDELRRRDEHRHETMKAIRRGDTAWALRHIAGPDAAIDYLRATEPTGTTGEDDASRDEPAEWQFPHRFVATLEELIANVATTPTSITLRAVGIDKDGDVVVEAQSGWVAGPPAVASFLGWDAPPPVDHFYLRAAFLADIDNVTAVVHRTAELAASIERLDG